MGRKKEILSFDEIVFENRNQDYGAYILRKKYNSTVVKSILAGIILMTVSVVVPFLAFYKKPYTYNAGGRGNYVAVKMENIQPPRQEIIIPPEIPPPPAPVQSSVKYTAPVIVDTLLTNELSLPTIEEARGISSENEEMIAAAGPGGDELFGEAGSNVPYDFFILEVPPSFRGGNLDKFREWLQKRVIYPQEAQEKGIAGTVYLTFIVERDGTVTNVNVVKGVHKLLDDEARQAIEASPPWSPGLQKGKPVRVRFSIHLNFML